jgi:multidrug efflux pump subunit AcrA (membrane-fusion protein)
MKRHAFLLVWLLAAAAAAWLMLARSQRSHELIGMVVARTHAVAPLAGGRVRELLVAVGTVVASGQPLARLDCSDLDAEETRLQLDRTRSQELIAGDLRSVGAENARVLLAHRQEGDRLRAQELLIQGERSEALARQAAREAETAALTREIDRLTKADAVGLGRALELGDLGVRRAGAEQFAHAEAATVAACAVRLTQVQQTLTAHAAIDVQTLTAPLQSAHWAHLEEVQSQLAGIVIQRARRTVVAPCAGTIVALDRLVGDSVATLAPVVTLQELGIDGLDAWLPESAEVGLAADVAVTVTPLGRQAAPCPGRIAFVHPGYALLPVDLLPSPTPVWGRKVRVALPGQSPLLPGERVRVTLVAPATGGLLPAAAAAEIPTATVPISTPPVPQPIRLPDALRARTRFEPSGVLWLADIERFLVISDDTGLPGSDDHAPWLFLMDRDGVVDDQPVVIAGITGINDLEAVTVMGPVADGRLLLVSSQSLSSRDRRPSTRQLLIEVVRSGRTFTVKRQVEFLTALTATETPDGLARLGLGAQSPGGRLLLNIEGAAWRDGALYLGLKQPVGSAGAAIWRVTDVESMLSGVLRPGQVVPYATLDLGPGAGISDLLFAADGRLLVLSTIPDGGAAQRGALHVVAGDLAGTPTARLLATWPGWKSEGIAVLPGAPGRYAVVFDAGAETPRWVTVTVPAP